MIKVLNIRCHVGAQIGAQVYTSIDETRQDCKMFMNDHGVFVTGKKFKPTFIPHSTIASATLDSQDFEKFIATQEVTETKRGPGRSPKGD